MAPARRIAQSAIPCAIRSVTAAARNATAIEVRPLELPASERKLQSRKARRVNPSVHEPTFKMVPERGERSCINGKTSKNAA
jgi:hypothetical protein